MPNIPAHRLEVQLETVLAGSSAYDLLDSAVAVFDSDGVLRYANPAFSRFDRSVRDTLENFGACDVLSASPEFSVWLKETLSSACGGEFSRNFYYSSRIRVALNLCARLLVEPNGQVQGAMITIAEETIEYGHRHLARSQQLTLSFSERIKVLDADKNASDLLIRMLLKEAPFAIVLMNANRQIVQINRAAEKMFGMSATEMIGRSCERILPCYGKHGCCPVTELNARIEAQEISAQGVGNAVLPLLRSVAASKNGSEVVLIEAFVDLREQKSAERAINTLSFYDALTSLPNRKLLMDRIRQAAVSCVRNAQQAALIFIDLDGFKVVNDTMGRSAGDLLLQEAAIRLCSCVRDGDTVARLGADEFVVMLEGLSGDGLVSASQTETVSGKILAALRLPFRINGVECRSTPSVGITLFCDQSQNADNLLRQAEIAMFQVKKTTHNGSRFFDLAMQHNIESRAMLEHELLIALEQQQFELHYQLQVDASDRPLGAEVLIRWKHPLRGMISPLQFIALAEDIGLIVPLGRWVLETACAQLKIWQGNARTSALVLSVNVSAKQLHKTDFSDQVEQIIARYGINPRRLKLEITESMLVDSIEDTIATMNRVKALGVQFSLDDFGTGYSSLQYLKRLPLDQLKIDQSFVRDIENDGNDRAIVRTIIAMAQSLNLNVIAEGVETIAQRQRLINKGCSHFQGYLFGRPAPIAQFEAALLSL